MKQVNYILKLLNFQDDNIKIVSFSETDNNIIITLSFDIIPENINCIKCNSGRLNVHANYTRKLKHIKIGNKNCIIYFIQPRLICLDCTKTFNINCPIADKGRRVTNVLIKNLSNDFSFKQSFKDISEKNSLSTATISNEFRKQIHEYRCKLTEVICIDEFKASTISGKYALIIGDPASGQILDILPSRQQDYLLYYFQTISKEEKSKVKYINTDLYESYRSIVKSEFPNALHIADRFHYIGLVYDAFNSLRIRTMNHYKNIPDFVNNEQRKKRLAYAEKLKKSYKLLVMNKYNKEDWYFDQIIKKDKNGNGLTINNVIEDIVNEDLDLCEAYSFLQEFYRICKFSNEDNAKTNIQKWCTEVQESNYIIPEIKKVTLTLISWINEIGNSFILNPSTHERMSNGFIEGKNNFCKTIKRIGFGYPDFDVFRSRILNCNRKK